MGSTTSNAYAIDLTDVAKTYRGGVEALRGIEMRVAAGEIFGLLGPNGAGKSTLVKILMTVIRPTRCTGTVLGQPVGDKATLRRVGYLPEHHRFPPYLKGGQVLDHFAMMSGIPRDERRRRADELLELVDMTEWRDKKVGGYSKGMRQRLGIANALINNPDLVLLDEPTDGVDPVGRRDIRNILTRLREQGKTVFLNSHLLSELEMVCDRVAILVQGKVVSQGTIEDLTAASRHYVIEVAEEHHTHVSGAVEPLTSAGPDGKRLLPTGIAVEITEGMLRVRTDDAEHVQPLIDALRARSAEIRTVRHVRASLEDLFMQAVTDPTTGEALRPGAGGRKGKRRARKGASK